MQEPEFKYLAERGIRTPSTDISSYNGLADSARPTPTVALGQTKANKSRGSLRPAFRRYETRPEEGKSLVDKALTRDGSAPLVRRLRLFFLLPLFFLTSFLLGRQWRLR